MIKTTFLALSILCGVATVQRVPLPHIDYSKYGSLHDQMVVRQNIQRQIDEEKIARYRAFRREVNRHLRPQRVVVVQQTTTYTYGDALASWRNRRDSVFYRR